MKPYRVRRDPRPDRRCDLDVINPAAPDDKTIWQCFFSQGLEPSYDPTPSFVRLVLWHRDRGDNMQRESHRLAVDEWIYNGWDQLPFNVLMDYFIQHPEMPLAVIEILEQIDFEVMA